MEWFKYKCLLNVTYLNLKRFILVLFVFLFVCFLPQFRPQLTAKSVYSENKELWVSNEDSITEARCLQYSLFSSSLSEPQFHPEQQCPSLISPISKSPYI